jgi:hypothetical protein
MAGWIVRRVRGIGWVLGAALAGGCLQTAKDLGGVKPDGGPPTVCTISGVTYAAAAPNPANDCEVCRPSDGATAWSHGADATPCGDAGRFCIDGACEAPCAIGGFAAREHQHNSAHLNQCCLSSLSTTSWSDWFQDGGQVALGDLGFFPYAGDFNGDGRPDLALEGATVNPGFVAILLNHGDGTFEAPQVFSFASPPPAGPVMVSDLNHDGFDDLVYLGGGAPSALINQRDGTFGASIQVMGVVAVAGMGDFNGDGIPDILGYLDVTWRTPQLQLGLGDGRFAPPRAIDLGAPSNETLVVPARLRGADHPLDLVRWDALSQTFSVALGDGSGGFLAPASYPSRYNFDSLQVLDFNGDGRDDLVGSGTSDSLLYVSLAQADGTLGPVSPTALDFPRGVERYLLAADFDGDQHPDLAGMSAEPPGQKVTNVLWRLPDGGLADPLAVGSPGYVIYTLDLNGDGAPDLFTLPTAGAGATAQVYLNACGAP